MWLVQLSVLCFIACNNPPSNEQSRTLSNENSINENVDVKIDTLISSDKTSILHEKSKDCSILFSPSGSCLDCNSNCFVFSDVPSDLKVNPILSSYFYNCLIDSCGLGKMSLLNEAIQTEYLVDALIDFYKGNMCTNSNNYSTDFFTSRKIELLVPLKKQLLFLSQITDSLLRINEIDGMMLLWKDFNYNELSHFQKFWEVSMERKNFFILCDLYILMSINGYDKLKKEVFNELKIQREDFSEYFDRLMVMEKKRDLTYYEYYSSMYFD